MRRLLPILALAFAALPVATADAATIAHVEGKITKSAGKTTLQVGGGMSNEDGSQPPTVSSLDLFLPSQLWLDLVGLKPCRRADLEQYGPGACPKASRLGAGSTTALAGGITANPTLTLFYGGEYRVLMLVHTDSPISIDQVIVAELAGTGGLYSLVLTIPVPPNLQEPIPGLKASITQIGATIGSMLQRGRKRHSLLRVRRCGSTGVHAFKAIMTLAGGGTLEASSTTPCG